MCGPPTDASSGAAAAQANARPGVSGLMVLATCLVALWVLAELLHDAAATARERARRAKCSHNLKCGIGFVCHMYSNDHRDTGSPFPPTIGHLFAEYVQDGGCFLCPSADKATEITYDSGPSHDGYTPAKFGDTHTDYVYVSGLRADDPADYVLAFDDEWNHGGEGAHAVHIGGHVTWLTDFGALHEQLASQGAELAARGRKTRLLRPAWSSWPDAPARPWSFGLPWRAAAAAVLVTMAVALARVVQKHRQAGSSGPQSNSAASRNHRQDKPD